MKAELAERRVQAEKNRKFRQEAEKKLGTHVEGWAILLSAL
jgi:hypothetical protein